MYSTLDDLKNMLPERVLLQLADDENAGEFVAVPANAAYTRVVDAIRRADTLIDGYISGRYSLPFQTTPDLVKDISVNLAVCELYSRNHEAVLPEAIAARRKDNIKTLENIQKGLVVLHEPAKTEPAEILVNKTADDRVFTDDLLGKM